LSYSASFFLCHIRAPLFFVILGYFLFCHSPVKPGNDKKEKSRGVTKKIEGTGMTEEKKKLSNDRNKYFI